MFWRRRIHKTHGEGFPVEVSEKDGVRFLSFGNGTVQSAMRIKRPNDLELAYTQAMMGFLLFSGTPRNVLMVGLGGGSLPKFFLTRLPSTRVVVVEREPRVVGVARSFFALPADGDRLRIEIGDGAAFLAVNSGQWDTVMVDGYDENCQVPHLASEDFYGSCRAALRPGGVAVINLWSSDRNFAQYIDRAVAAFDGQVLCLPAEKKGNVIVFGFESPPRLNGWGQWRERAHRLEITFGIEFGRFADALVERNRHDADGWVFSP